MKKRLFLFMACAIGFSQFCFAQKTDVSLYGDLTSAYQSEAYPAVVEYAGRLESEFPRSLLMGKAFALKGESEYRLGRLTAAKATLAEALKLCVNDPETQIAASYWYGKTLSAQGQQLEALTSFYNSCNLYKSNFENYSSSAKTDRYYDLSVFNSAEILFALEVYEKAIPLYEYVIQGGCGYSSREYDQALIHLFECYGSLKKWQETKSVFVQVYEWDFNPQTKGQLYLLAGQAFENLKEYRTAYEIYCQVLTGEDPTLASIALQKTYSVASNHPSEVGEEPGRILANAENLSEYSGLVGEFWVRLGIDSYNSGDYSKASSYFDNAEAVCLEDFIPLIGLYRSEIAANYYSASPKTAASTALGILSNYAAKTSLDEQNQWFLSYCCSFVKWYAMEENWEQALVYGEVCFPLLASSKLDQRIKLETCYWYGTALFTTGNHVQCAAVLDTQNIELNSSSDSLTVKAALLKAKSYARIQKVRDAINVFEAVSVLNKLTEEDKLDYSKLLLSAGYLSSAFRLASSLSQQEAAYIAGLAAFNRKDWSSAEKYFTKYLSRTGSWSAYASFYNGYSQYKLGELLSAYRNLSDFAKKNPGHPLCYNARIVAANAAVQNNRYSEAAAEADEAIRIAPSPEEYQKAVMLSASIYTDFGQYDKAVAVLRNSAGENSAFGIRARYQTAEIYARKGDLENCDRIFLEIVTDFPDSSLADESAYRRGEVFYAAGVFDQAAARFNLYLDQFKNGLFEDASSFYLADSLAKTEQVNRAIMQYLVLIKKSPDSTYVYTAKKNLVNLYRQQGNYKEALSLAEAILSEYDEIARKDDVEDIIDQIRMLMDGTGEEMIVLASNYKKAGQSTTAEGRAMGTRLAMMKWEFVSSQNEAVSLAEEIYAVQKTKGDAEAEYACRTALIIAQYDRQQNSNQAAAQLFMESASLALKAGDDQCAQLALYGAAEAFDAAGMFADCQSVVETLQELYPDGEYIRQALELLNE